MEALTDTAARAAFWKSVDEHAMRLPYCNSCQSSFFYPRSCCPKCWSTDIGERRALGQGEIVTFTVVRQAHANPSPWHERIPYVVALVKLEEDVQMLANIVDCDVEAVRSGIKVRLTYVDIGDRCLPAFMID